MKHLFISMSVILAICSCNMVSTVQKSTSAIQENQQAVTASTYRINENLETVQRSSIAIQENLEIVEVSTQQIRENASAVESSTQMIRRNAEAVERSTQLLDKLHVNEGIADLLVLGIAILFFGMPIIIAGYLATINRKMTKFMKEYKKNRF